MAVSSPLRIVRGSGLTILLAVACVSLASASSSSRASAAVTPVEKVVNLLKQLQVQVEEEGKTEATQYDHFACFCKEQTDEKLYMIDKSAKKVALLNAKIDELGGEITGLEGEVQALAASIVQAESDIASAANTRAAEHKAYLSTDADLQDAIASLKGAIEALKTSKAQMDGAKLDLAQLRAFTAPALAAIKRASAHTAVAVPSVLAQLAGKGGQLPPSYEYRSNSIITTLEELLVKFTGYKKDADTEEFDINAAYEKKDLDLKTVTGFKEKEKALKESIIEKKSEEKSAATEDMTSESKDKAADQSFLDVLKAECEQKATDWDQRSQTRAGELTAIAGALKALSEGVAPSWVANKKLAEIQTRRHANPPSQATRPVASFLQLRGAHSKASGATAHRSAEGVVVKQVAQLLSSVGARLGSSALSVAAARVQASEDHFVKVRSIIKDLVARLQANAEAEQTQKSYCDKWMAVNVESRDKSKAEIESLEAQHSQLKAEDATLKNEIAALASGIAGLLKSLREATELRNAERAENKKTVETAKEGKATVELAISLLSTFYSEAAGALIQTAYVPPDSDRAGKTVSDRAPEIWEGQYRGKQADSKGIIGLLQVILSDFTRTIDTVTTEEGAAQEAFEGYEAATQSSVEEKAQAKTDKEARVAAVADELTGNADALQEQRALLADAEAGLAELKADCVEGEETYEERVARRHREIEALKEAHRILDEWDA